MPGGTCEATAYQLAGYRSAALCVALRQLPQLRPQKTRSPPSTSPSPTFNPSSASAQKSPSAAPRKPAVKALKKRLKTNAEKYRKMLKKRV